MPSTESIGRKMTESGAFSVPNGAKMTGKLPHFAFESRRLRQLANDSVGLPKPFQSLRREGRGANPHIGDRNTVRTSATTRLISDDRLINSVASACAPLIARTAR